MRIRTLKPEFHSSFSIAALSEPAVILAVALLNHADDRGYFEADPRIIKCTLFPLREPSKSIQGMLMELVTIRYIELRTALDHRLVGIIINFAKHQVVNRPSKTISSAQRDFETGRPAAEFAEQAPSDELPLNPAPAAPITPPAPPPEESRSESTEDEAKEPTAEGRKFVDWFLTLLRETQAPDPRLTPAVRRNWGLCYDRMLRIDGRTKERVKEVCTWARKDSFWRNNFLSPAKLREKKEGVMYFDRFAQQMGGGDGGTSHQTRRGF